jgi:hypothetical protein
MNPYVLATLPYIRETLAENTLGHFFLATWFISLLAAVIMGNMYFRKPKLILPSRRKALAILVTTIMFPTAFLVADLILATLDGIPITTLLNISLINVFAANVFIYLVLLMVHGLFWIVAIRKFPTEL